MFVVPPGAERSRALVEGENIDAEVSADIGPDAPFGLETGGGKLSEEQLLLSMRDHVGQLQACYHVRRDKLDSREAVIKEAEEALENCFEETQVHFDEAYKALQAEREKLKAEDQAINLWSDDVRK
ncbi:hypothetical protein ZWY2020_046695 [Hordeum vulgare]|nr:hypothetical protein ZWY2020_046695 [Hordeum vulgare]